LVVKNLIQKFGALDLPFGLYVGSEDELVRGERLVKLVNSLQSKAPLKDIQLVSFGSHVGNLITSTAYIVPFMRKFTKIVAPSLSFKLRNPNLDDFEKLDFIGRGSFGRVYLVKHKISEKFFALKVLSKAELVETREISHVISERNILRDTNSSFVVSFVGSMQDAKHLYIMMEYVIGGELYTQLSLRKRFSNDAARFYAAEIVLFFEDIHPKNVIYRDLKPENILIDAMGHIKVTDMVSI
jgi:serine/threonine protein kinase